MRRALGHVNAAWFEGQVQRLSSNPDGRRREILHRLIARAACSDLHVLAEATKPPPAPHWELWRQGFLFDQVRYVELCTRQFAPDENLGRFIELAREAVCVDARFRIWARPMLRQPSLSNRIRGEAILLLDAAKQLSDKKDQKLRETFLLHKVADLRAVCHPWHPEIEWKDLETAG